MSEVYDKVNEAFQNTFRIIFGECNVELKDMRDYLWKYHYPLQKRKSAISDKDVYLCETRYCPKATIISYDEIDFTKKFQLNINEIKDIDSVVAATREQFQYCGNTLSGRTGYIEASDGITDSFYVYDSHHFLSSKYAACSSYVRDTSEYTFGSSYFLRSKHLIRTIAADNLNRCFETYISTNGSDLFFCYDCVGCTNTMFSFNLRNKSNCIGNLQLPREKYVGLRKKLVEESREYLEKNKDFYSMFESLPALKEKPKISVARKPRPSGDMKPLEEAWGSVCRIILGKEIGPLQRYEKFLSQRINPVVTVKTAYGSETYNSDLFYYKYIPGDRIVNQEEAIEVAKQHLSFEDGKEVSLESVMEKISPIAFFRTEFAEGSNANNMETQIPYTATNTYKSFDVTFAKNCAYDTMALNSDYAFGCFRVLHSKFCIKAHGSVEVSNCFEVDCSTNLRDSYFCHDVEGSDNCMFCFNTKSKRYAIGNVEVGRENYMKIKKIVLDEITQKLEKDGELPFDIFTLGCYKGKKG